MRILLFHYYSNKPNPVYQEMASAFRVRGHEVWLAEPNEAGDLLIKGENGTLETISGPKATLAWARKMPIVPKLLWRYEIFSFLMRFRALIKKLSPDIVQINPLVMAWLLPLGMPKSIHFVLDIRQINEAVKKNFKTRIREQMAVNGMRFNGRYFYEKTCFCHEQAAIRILGEKWHQKGVVVPVGVDDQFNDYTFKDNQEPPTNIRSFIYIGTLSRLRNLEKLLEAAKMLCQKTGQFKLDLIGPDTSEGYYQTVIEKLGIESVAAVKPPVAYEDVPGILAGYDVGLAYVPDRPTWHYQPTIKVLEYRALGLPIISTDVASHREVVQQNVNGVLCADTPDALAEAMYQFVEPEFFQTIQQNSRNMRRGNTWLDIADMYVEKTYNKLIN